MKILICDNDIEDAAVVVQNLKKLDSNIEAVITGDWSRIVSDIAIHRPDIVIVDLFWHCQGASERHLKTLGIRIDAVKNNISNIKSRYVGASKTILDSGIQALTSIRTVYPKSTLPVLILTRFGNFLLDPGSKDVAYSLGSGFLYKWADARSQLHKIYGALGRPCGKRIFISHGWSAAWEQLRAFLSDNGLRCDDFNRESSVGLTAAQVLESKLGDAAFAFVVMTADEPGAGKAFARQNVIHEAGFAQGRLGQTRAAILLEEGCEEFSNMHGVQHIPFKPGQIARCFDSCLEVLKREKLYPPPAWGI